MAGLNKTLMEASGAPSGGTRAWKFKRILNLVEAAASKAFEIQYGSLNGFSYNVTSSNNRQIRPDDNIFKLNSFFAKIQRTTLNYKFTIDNGSSDFCDMYFRSPRAEIINFIIKELDQRRSKINTWNLDSYELKTSGNDMKNPTLYLRIMFTSLIKNKKGKVITQKIPININLALKYAGENKSAKELKDLKPSKVPGLTDAWLSPDQFKNKVISYINSNSFPSKNISLKESYTNIVNDSYKNQISDSPSIASDLSSEFFEILSALKAARLLQENNSYIMKVFGLPVERVDRSKVKIYIPQKANEPLTDYEISYDKDSPKYGENGNLKISVKSKVRGSSAATVKFDSLFSNVSDVNAWFNKLASKIKTRQVGQFNVARSALSYKSYGQITTLYPIRAIKMLLSSVLRGRVNSDFSRVITGGNVNSFRKICAEVDKKITSNKPSVRYIPVDELISDKKLLKECKTFIAHNLGKNTKDYISALDKLPELKGEKYVIQGTDEKYPFSLNNFALICERVVVATSKKEGSSKLNFYKMFYDNVLTKKEVAYSVLELIKQNDEVRLHYGFYSKYNFNKYKTWIALRSKNYAFNMQDALAMDV
jgi:hypothetical protein